MIPYIGDFAVNSTLRYFYASNAAAGASAARTTAGAYRVYKNISTTERTSSAGITDFSGFDSVTGLNAVTIDLSNNTDAGFYAAGNDYVVVLVGAVVDSQTINVPLFQFSIANRSPTVTVSSMNAGTITSTTIANDAITLRLANDGVPSNARFTTYDTFSGYPVLSQSAQHQISITGSHHAAADVHAFQPSVIDSAATDSTFIEEIADGVLSRNLDSSGNGADSTNERTVRSALRAMRNKVDVSSGTIVVYKEDDATQAWAGTLSNTADVTVNPTGGS